VARARAGDGPTLIDAKVPRLTSHSSDDDQRRYRSAEALATDRSNDCLSCFAVRLGEQGVLSAGDEEAMRAELLAELDVATAEAEAAPDPEPESVLLHVLGGA
jgi:2-oxoisovalerate dehydrogenase E1 component alpha subunit